MNLSNKKSWDLAFISDLHLHPEEPEITQRFYQFIDWAAPNVSTLYILGDFFHAWPGDDGLDVWSRQIAQKLQWLSQQQVAIYFMAGNRDFLLGQDFAALAEMTILSEPCVIQCGEHAVLLVHGDRYCLMDKSHQRFRRLTRNRLFVWLFLKIPLRFRARLVSSVRAHSQSNKSKSYEQMDVVPNAFLKEMDRYKADILIHGHTHKPALRFYEYNGIKRAHYVLSDWEESPRVLCYNESKGFDYI